MMEFFQFADGAEKVVGLIVALFSIPVTVIVWFSRRMDRATADIKGDIREDIAKSSQDDRTRLGRVEHDVKRLETRVTDIDGRMETGFKDVEARMGAFERELMTVAKKDDLTEIKVQQAQMDARLGTLVENDRRLLDQLTAQGGNIAKMFDKVMSEKK